MTQSLVAALAPILNPADLDGPTQDYLVVPHHRRPRLLIPAGSSRAAAAAVRRAGESDARLKWLTRGAAATLLASGLGRLWWRDRIKISAGIGEYLSRALDTELLISVQVGPHPMLRLLSPTGVTLGFAKLAATESDRALITHEAQTLHDLSELVTVVAPRILHQGVWQGYDVVVTSALPVWERRATLDAASLHEAMLEVAAPRAAVPLGESPYRERLRATLAEAGEAPEMEVLTSALRQAVARGGDIALTFGAWHGDWTPAHMAARRVGLLVWNWERYATDVPVGFDALHHQVASAVRAGQTRERAVEACLRTAPALLWPWGMDARAARLTALLYLIELGTRSGSMDQGGLDGPGIDRWLLPTLTTTRV